MYNIECFRGISNKLLVFGLKPVDIVLILIGFMFVHGFINSLVVDAIYIVGAYVLAKNIRNRPDNVLLSLCLYFTTPMRLPVPTDRERTKTE